jgi:hypothetical protein
MSDAQYMYDIYGKLPDYPVIPKQTRAKSISANIKNKGKIIEPLTKSRKDMKKIIL